MTFSSNQTQEKNQSYQPKSHLRFSTSKLKSRSTKPVSFSQFNSFKKPAAPLKQEAKTSDTSATSGFLSNTNQSKRKQVVPRNSGRMSVNIHRNHTVTLEDSYSSKSAIERFDSLAPPPRRNQYRKDFFPVTGFESSSLKEEEVDEFTFSSQRLVTLRRQNHRTNRSPPTPPQSKQDLGKLTLVLDIDETLIHSKISPKSMLRKAKQDQVDEESQKSNSMKSEYFDEFEITLSDGERVRVKKRPGLDEFLKYAGERYEVMAYTAGLKQYAEPLLEWLDPEGKIFKHKLYRDSCLFSNGYYVKDLEKVNRNLSRTVLVDNNLCCFLPQLSNGIPISSFYDDANDDALSVLRGYLETLDCEIDVRPYLAKSFNLVQALSSTRDMVLG